MPRLSYSKMTILLAVLLVAPTLAETVTSTSKATLPRAHIIENVPWNQQFNALSCGASALEILFDYWGPDIDQKEIMNVARSSSSGTYAPDIVRAGHFSYLSDAQGSYFPTIGPYGGFKERPLGYAAFSHTSNKLWLNELKMLIANDMPIIVLMKYYPWGGGGHYRVVIGYDDDQELIYFSDPWGRDLNHVTNRTGTISWRYSDFQMGWNYAEYGAANPYFGAAIMPWSIHARVNGRATSGAIVTVTASIEYPCPQPFDNTQYPAHNAIAEITLPEGMRLLDGSITIPLGTIRPGSSTKVTWKVVCENDSTGETVLVSAWGAISGWVPDARWQGQTVYYPAYSYTDAIGGETRLLL